jgi:prepilin-type N-terminal cleavage/methylation domain-containing protein
MSAASRGERGFTLIELMIVTVILGLLLTIAIPNFNRIRQRAYEATMKSDLHAAFICIEDYRVQNALNLPPTSAALEATTDMQLSPHVLWDRFAPGQRNGIPSVDITLAHERTTSKWGSWYPSDPTFIEAR